MNHTDITLILFLVANGWWHTCSFVWKEDCRTAESYGSGMLPTHTKRNTPMERPAQESGPPGHPDDDFVHVTPQERPLPLTLQAISRYMVLRGESRPAVIPEEQMERFRFMLDYSPEAVEICSTPLAAGDAVKVIKGPLAGLEGELVMIGEKQSGSPAGYAGLRTCGHADRIRGEN